ncbi:MAG: ABC transporter ATP-binding protein [Aestuariivirga sp.]
MFARLIKLFFTAPGARPFSVLCAMILSSLSDTVGMGALVPLTSQLSNDQGSANSFLGVFTIGILHAIGLSPNFLNLLIILGVALILKSAIAFLAMSFVSVSVANVATGIRTRLMKATMNAKWSYFVSHPPGEVASMIAAQAQGAGDAYQQTSALFTNIVVTSGLLITAFLVSGPLVIFCLAAVAGLAIPLFYILQRARDASMKQFARSASLATGIQDVIANMKALKSMAKQGRFVDAFMHSIRDLRSAVIAMNVSRFALYNGQDILATMMIIGGVYVGVGLLHTPISQLLVIGIIFYQMVDAIKRTQLSVQDAVMASAGYYGVLGIVEKAESQFEPDTGTMGANLKHSMVFKDVSFSYTEKQVLEHVNLAIPAGSITVLIGESGAGKTTIVDMIVGLNRPAGGVILLDGIDMAEVSLKAWRTHIGYVPQEMTLLRGSIADNITLGDPDLTEADLVEALKLAGAWDFVSALPDGANSDIGTMGAKLSGGQRQRLSLARALVHKPSLLLLDEVTSALDQKTELEICNNIRGLLGKLTIVAITHRPAWISVATKVYSVEGGTVRELQGQDQKAKCLNPTNQ